MGGKEGGVEGDGEEESGGCDLKFRGKEVRGGSLQETFEGCEQSGRANWMQRKRMGRTGKTTLCNRQVDLIKSNSSTSKLHALGRIIRLLTLVLPSLILHTLISS